MLDYYKNGTKSPAGLTDEVGNLLSNTAPDYADIKTLISQVRDVRGTLGAAKDAPVKAKDYFATQFDGAISKLLKSRVNGFEELQSSFAPMANTRKVAYEVFKPLSDKSSINSFVGRIQKGNLTSADSKLIKFLEDGGEISGTKIRGIGKFASKTKKLGDKLADLKSGREIDELKVQLSKKASDEKFRNRLFAWAGVAAGLGGVAKAKDFVTPR